MGAGTAVGTTFRTSELSAVTYGFPKMLAAAATATFAAILKFIPCAELANVAPPAVPAPYFSTMLPPLQPQR